MVEGTAHLPTFNEAEWRMLSVMLDRQVYMRMAGLQFDGRRNLYDIFGYDRIVTSQQYRDEYARGGIANSIVNAFPKATWRGGVELYEDEDPNTETEFEKAWHALETKFGVWNKLQNADILAGQSTYSAILLGAPGSLDEELPRNSKLLYVQPFFGGGGPGNQSQSPSSRTLSSNEDVTIETFDVDTASERFGEPLTYRIRRVDLSSPMLAKPVHWSRIIHICEGALDNNVYGVPTLESIWNLLFDLEKITGGGAESHFQRAKHTLNANIGKDASYTPADVAALKEKLEEYMHGITNLIPTHNVDLKLIEATSANFAAPADAILKQIAGATGIPMRILTGSEMGTLASEQDAANFDSRVKDRRTGYAGPMIVRKFVDRLIAYGYLPTPKQYEVGWPVEESMDEAGKATFAVSLATVNKTYGAPIFSDDEIRDMAFDKPPLPDVEPYENLSEIDKANLAMKLALVNKEQGITVFTDDEIRKMSYGLEPLSDAQKVPIAAPVRETAIATDNPDAKPGAPADGVKPGGLPAAKTPGALPAPQLLAAEIRELEQAIENDDLEKIGTLLDLKPISSKGLGDRSFT